MRKLNCFIIDDEQHARELLKHYIEKDERLKFIGASNNASIFNPTEQDIDLLFLDIQMPGMTGIEFLEQHQPTFKTILTTAFRQYALKGYELGVADYLLKPILFERFKKSIEAVIREVEMNEKAQKFDQIEAEKDAFTLKSGMKTIRLTPEYVQYIEAKGEYISINTENDRFLVYMRMKEVEENQHFKNLIRIHRSFFINPKYIREQASEFVVINDLQIPIGRSYKTRLKSL